MFDIFQCIGNYSDNLGFHRNKTVKETKNEIEKSVKKIYDNIINENDNISNEDLKSSLDKGLTHEKLKFEEKGYKDYISDVDDKMLKVFVEEQKKKKKKKKKEKRKLRIKGKK